ncbi:hypothetical protein V6L77_00750 [Pannonibacter sp. Pt2-lr]
MDGIIGRATLETMQREIDAQARSTAAATGASGEPWRAARLR